MKHETAWLHWAMGSARSWRDISSLVPETGIDIIDSDHRILLEFAVNLNLLAEDAAIGFSEELLGRQRALLHALQEYTKYHFDREEAFIQTIGARNLDLQRTEHAQIMQSLDEVSHDFASGRLSVSTELRRSIFAWIVDHISNSDIETFRLANLQGALKKARSWFDVKGIFRSTGIDSLDSQHRSLVNGILEFSTALHEKSNLKILGAKFDSLNKVTHDHFAFEEAFMGKYGIEGLEEQKTLHAAFLERLRGFKVDLAESSEKPLNSDLIVHELMTWLVEHVNGQDYNDFRRRAWLIPVFETCTAEDLAPLVRTTGIKQVDAAHQEFIGKATTFGDSVAGYKGGSIEIMTRQFDDLIAFAERHFQDEEGRFSEPSSLINQKHRNEHSSILEALTAYRLNFMEGRIGAATASRSILLKWWINHTNATDIQSLGSAVFDGEAEHGF